MPKFLDSEKYLEAKKPYDPELGKKMDRAGIRAIGGLDAFKKFAKEQKLIDTPRTQQMIKEYEEYLEQMGINGIEK